VANARESIGSLSHGCEIFCLTDGQFSLFDILEVLLEKTGPADVIISTWTAAGADTKKAKAFLTDGNIRSIRWVVDRSFLSRQPEYCKILINEFGDCLRSIRTHCKFITVTNDDWAFVLRTSMNLNSNPRIEDFEISEDRDFAEYFIKFTDSIFENCALDDNFKSMANKGRIDGFDDMVESNDYPTGADIISSMGL
jgi:hypothetical protein